MGDGLGNAIIEWSDIVLGRKGSIHDCKKVFLKRDFDKLIVIATVVKEEDHPNWAILDGLLMKKSGADKATGIAEMHSKGAREEIARKLIRNHKNVIADLTNTSKTQNIDGKPLTQLELHRLPKESKGYIDQMLREVARRLLGDREGTEDLKETPDPKNEKQKKA